MKEKQIAKGMAVLMAVEAVMLSGCGTQESAEEQQVNTTHMSSDEAASMLYGTRETKKKEEVYVLMDADGEVESVTVSDVIRNSQSGAINDRSRLTNITNLSGDENYSLTAGGGMLWEADGQDISYQGLSNEELPFALSITYRLNGEVQNASQLKGKSGELSIEYSFENKLSSMEIMDDGSEKEVIVPFMALSILTLSDEHAADIKVDHGRVVNKGDSNIIVAYAFPGLEKCLKDGIVDDEGLLDDLSLPEGFTITADVQDFEMGMSMTMVSNSMLDELNDSMPDTSKLSGQMEDLDEASKKLMDGTKELMESTMKLRDGSDELKDGVVKLYDGTGELKDGMTKLTDASGELTGGWGDIKDGINKVYDTIPDIKDGADSLSDGAGDLKAGLDKYLAGADQIKDGAKSFGDGGEQLSAGLKQLKEGAAAVDAAVQQLNTGAAGLVDGANSLSDGANELNEGISRIPAALSTVPDQIKSNAQQQVDNSFGSVEALDEAITKAAAAVVSGDTEEARAEAMNTYNALLGAKASYMAAYNIADQLAGQLDTGDLSQLTAGAQQLAAGANALSAGAAQLNGGLSQLAEKTPEFAAGMDTAAEGGLALGDGAAKLYTALDALTANNSKLSSGAADLRDGAAKLADGLGEFREGVRPLAEGAADFSSGLWEYTDGVRAAADGAGELFDGGSELLSGMDEFNSYMYELYDGTVELNDGVIELNEEAISKLTKLLGDDLEDAMELLDKIRERGTAYRSFSGIDDDMNGDVVFILKTAEIR